MPFAEKMKRDVWNRQRGLCNYCGLGLTFNGGCEMDHSVPKSWGGKDVIENAQLLCCQWFRGLLSNRWSIFTSSMDKALS